MDKAMSRPSRISLRLWVFKYIDTEDIDSFGVCVEGYRSNDETESVLRNWHSTCIKKRLSSSLVMSRGGTLYELRGCIDRELAHHYGHPTKLIAMFTNGFPENWKSILKEYHMLRTINPLSASHYFSPIARRRSLNTIRGKNLLMTHGLAADRCLLDSRSFSTASATPALFKHHWAHFFPSVEKTLSNRPVKPPSNGGCPSSASYIDSHATPDGFEEEKENCIFNKDINGTSTAADPSGSNASPLRRETEPKVGPLVAEDRQILDEMDVSEVGHSNISSCNKSSEEAGDIKSKPCVTTDASIAENLFKSHGEDSFASAEPSFEFVFRQPERVLLPIVSSPEPVSSQPLQQNLTSLSSTEEQQRSHRAASDCQEGTEESKGSACGLTLARVSVYAKTGRLQGELEDDAVQLSEWSLRFCAPWTNGPSLGFPKFILLGTRKGHPNQWQSSIVVRVESASILYTSTTKYRLVGEINIMDCAFAGFPKVFVDAFLYGFPPNWKTMMTELYNSFFGHLEHVRNHYGDVGSARAKHTLFADADEDVNEHTYGYGSKRRDEEDNRAENVLMERRYLSENVEEPNNRSAVSNWQKMCGPVARRTRSDRYEREPLAESAGQRARYDGHMNVMGIEEGNTLAADLKLNSNMNELITCSGVSASNASRQCVEKAAQRDLTTNGRHRNHLERRTSPKRYDSTDNILRGRRKRWLTSSSDEDCSVRKHGKYRAFDDTNEFEQEIREERRLILEQARELRKQQMKLLAMEKRIAENEEKWRRKMEERSAPCSNHSYHTGVRKSEVRVYHEIDRGNNKQRRRWPNPDEGEAIYQQKLDLERKRLEEQWALEDEQISNHDDLRDDSWFEPARKKRSRRKVQVQSSSSSQTSTLEDENSEESEASGSAGTSNPNCQSGRTVHKDRYWNRAELHRLKLVLAANTVSTDEDWEKIARSLGSSRDAESCRQAAIKRLKWQPSVCPDKPHNATVMEVTARVGTVAYHQQSNEYARKFLMGGDGQSEDFFRHNDASMCEGIPDVAEFRTDDSLLEAIQTPVDVAPQRKVSNRRQFLPEAVDEDTPIRRRSSRLFVQTPTNSVQRERHVRYFHHLMNNRSYQNDVSGVNYSRIRNTTRDVTCLERTNTVKVGGFPSIREELDDVVKMARKTIRRNDDSDESNAMEDENCDSPCDL